jgi:hypothetical protein
MENILSFDEFLNESVKFDKRSLKEKLKEKLELAKMAVEKWGSSYYKDNLDVAEKAANSGILPGSYNRPWLVQGGDRQEDGFEIFRTSNAMDLAKAVGDVVRKYKKYETEESSRPAMAGWSGNMRSTVGGMIKGNVNFNNGKNNYLICVIVGGGVDNSIRKKIFEELYPIFFMMDEYNSSNGGVMMGYDSGTNYDTFGLKCTFSQFSQGFAGQLIKSMT